MDNELEIEADDYPTANFDQLYGPEAVQMIEAAFNDEAVGKLADILASKTSTGEIDTDSFRTHIHHWALKALDPIIADQIVTGEIRKNARKFVKKLNALNRLAASSPQPLRAILDFPDPETGAADQLLSNWRTISERLSKRLEDIADTQSLRGRPADKDIKYPIWDLFYIYCDFTEVEPRRVHDPINVKETGAFHRFVRCAFEHHPYLSTLSNDTDSRLSDHKIRTVMEELKRTTK